MQQQRAFFYSVLLLSNASELTKGVADVVVARTENSLVSAIEEAKELILRRIEMTVNHLDLLRDRKTGVELSFASCDAFDWFNVCVHWTFIIQ